MHFQAYGQNEHKMQPFTKKYQCTGTANQIIVVSVSLN